MQAPRVSGHMLCALVLACGGLAFASGAPAPVAPPVERPEVRFTITEDALLNWLKAATPYTFSVGNQILKVDLTLSEPRDLRLQDSRATLKIRLRGASLGVDQLIQPVLALSHDAAKGKYSVVVSSLPVQIPGFGAIDLKDSFPRFEIPELLEDFYRFGDRPVALNLDIRRIAVLEHALEIGAEVTFAPAAPAGTRGAR